jgi:hypothetical protein
MKVTIAELTDQFINRIVWVEGGFGHGRIRNVIFGVDLRPKIAIIECSGSPYLKVRIEENTHGLCVFIPIEVLRVTPCLTTSS